MSTNDNRTSTLSELARSGAVRETTFVVGLLGGVLVFSAGIVLTILGLAIGFRAAPTYPVPMPFEGGFAVRVVFALGLLAVIVAGIWIRQARGRFAEPAQRWAMLVGGTLLAAAGIVLLELFLSAKRTLSAPYLVSSTDKFILLGGGLLALYAGWWIVRRAGKAVGW